MQLIELSNEQFTRFSEMYYALHQPPSKHLGYELQEAWLEICLYHIAPLVAASHGKQPFTTPEWSKHLVLQKLINELHRVNPIDTLYDIWKHPEKYAQDL